MRRGSFAAAGGTATLLLSMALSGCGLKGDLYLPPEPLEPATPAVDEASSETTRPSATGNADSAGTTATSAEPTAETGSTTLPAEPPRQPEPDPAIEATDDFGDRPREDLLQ